MGRLDIVHGLNDQVDQVLCRFTESLEGIRVENLGIRRKAVPLSETNYFLLQITPGLPMGHSRDAYMGSVQPEMPHSK